MSKSQNAIWKQQKAQLNVSHENNKMMQKKDDEKKKLQKQYTFRWGDKKLSELNEAERDSHYDGAEIQGIFKETCRGTQSTVERRVYGGPSSLVESHVK